jgi:glycosyltransferase involved in cell wall biosynthesis
MKIAQLHPYPPELTGQIPVLPGGIAQGGSETSTFMYAYKLAEAGHDVTYCVAKYPGINVDSINLNKKFRIVYYNTIFKNVGPAFSFRLFWDLFNGKFDVIQSHQIPTMFSLTGAVAAKIRRKPFIITFHGRLPFNFIDRSVGTLASALSKAVTVQNQYAYDLVKDFVPNNKLTIIPHGIDTNKFRKITVSDKTKKKYKNNNEKIVLFVGRLIPAKGIDVLIESFALVNKVHSNSKLIIAGDGPQRKIYEEQAKKSSSFKSIDFIGSVSQEFLPQLYSIADVFVLPSTYHYADGTEIPKVSENFGLVIAEAMSSELPVVASSVGGIPHWITDGITARLVQERNVDALATAITDVLSDKDKKNKHIIYNAKKLIKDKYSWEAVIKQFEPLFNK